MDVEVSVGSVLGEVLLELGLVLVVELGEVLGGG